ncbi:MAG: hypothetical protein LBJ31_05840 [Treponema sp.]|nr:hypothetical protein [Treponema sp.]
MNNKLPKIIFLSALTLVLISTNGNGESGFGEFKPVTKKGEMSEITLAYARRQNYITREGKREIYPDGIVFYFVIYRLKNELKTPTLVELRDFKVNSVSYLEITRKNNMNDIEPNTVIFNERTFQEDEYYTKTKIQNGSGALIEKVIICGSSLPNNGVIDVTLKFGFDNRVEEYNYQFNIEDIEG